MGRENSFPEAEDSSGFKDKNKSIKYDGMAEAWKSRDGSIISNDGIRLEREDSESKAGSIMRDLDPWTAWFYKPHTVTVLVAGACLLVYVFFLSAILMKETSDRSCSRCFHIDRNPV